MPKIGMRFNSRRRRSQAAPPSDEFRAGAIRRTDKAEFDGRRVGRALDRVSYKFAT